MGKCSICGAEEILREETPFYPATDKPLIGTTQPKNNRIITLLVLALIVGVIGSYYLGNIQGVNAGYKDGFGKGDVAGYTRGYNTGFTEGDITGYNKGKNDGYSSGYASGKTAGYSEGYYKGNSDGYSNGYSKGNTTGYDSGYLKGVKDGAGRGYTLRDPTYQEMTNFISLDQTDKMTYQSKVFTCENFASTVKQNAFTKGYRCFYVAIDFTDSGHALNAFNTTDRGLIYIEPQSDSIMHPIVGKTYWDRSIYSAPSFDDTVKQILLIP